MSMRSLKVILLDCQTTGTSAARDRLLEIGWSCTSAEAPFPPATDSALIKQPEPLPKMVREITGITDELLESSLSPAAAWEKFHLSSGESSIAVAHYAQFERPFLEKFYAEHGSIKVLPFPVLCTYKIAKRLFPEAPSRNIRGLAGFLGCEITELRRAQDHVLATALIWQRVSAELDARGILNVAELEKWLEEKPSPSAEKKKVATSFHVDRLKRLKLPKGPGIYRMLSKTGEILYVGKATSLKSRVNSYFTGGCASDRRKLEMLARVYDVQVEECESPLEAALLENEEIKKHVPRYNKALRPSPRTLAFFSRDFVEVSVVQDETHPLGPFRDNSSLCQVFSFVSELKNGKLAQIFYDPFPEEAIQEGFALFLREENFSEGEVPSVRALLTWGMKQVRQIAILEGIEAALEEAEEEIAGEAEEADEKETEEIEIPEPEQVAATLRRLLIHAAEEYLRAKQLGRLLNASVSWEAESGKWRSLTVRDGNIHLEESKSMPKAYPWAGLKGEEYDRMSVLLSELNRFPHRIE